MALSYEFKANIAPITALCLFGGAYLPRKFAFLPLLVLLISDFFIGFYGIPMLYTYGSFALVGLVGLWLKKHKSAKFVLGSSLLSSLLFFIVSNFGVWAPPSNWYPHTLSGLIDCYTLAIPFFRNTILGDLGYTVILFGGYELIQRFARKYLPERIIKFTF